MCRLLPTLLILAAVLGLASPASAADGDLVHVRIRLAMETTHSAVASEGAVTDHDKRVVVVRNWISSPEIWIERAVTFVRTQDATQLDTCTGDGIGGVESWECVPNGTQAAIDTQLSAWLSVLVNAGHGG